MDDPVIEVLSREIASMSARHVAELRAERERIAALAQNHARHLRHLATILGEQGATYMYGAAVLEELVVAYATGAGSCRTVTP
jgi:phage-related tail protein